MTYIVTFLVLTILVLIAWPSWKAMRRERFLTSARMLEKDIAAQRKRLCVCSGYATHEDQYAIARMRVAADDHLEQLAAARHAYEAATDSSGIWSYSDIWPTGPNQVWAQSEQLAAATLQHLSNAYAARQAALWSIDQVE